MPILKLRPITSSEGPWGQQKPQEPEMPAKPAVPAKPAEPAKPSKPAEPAKPESAAVNWDSLLNEEEQDDMPTEDAVLNLIRAYLVVFPDPTPDQIDSLATALDAKGDDLEKVIMLCRTPTSPAAEEIRDTDYLEAKVTEVASTEVADTEVASTEVASTEETDDFLLPMSTMDDAADSEEAAVTADVAPQMFRTGTDDGGLSNEDAEDREEQDALNNDGWPNPSDEFTEVNNRKLNDDNGQV